MAPMIADPTQPPAAMYAQLLEHSLEAAFLTRTDGPIFYGNPAACALFGYSQEEFVRLGRAAILDPNDPRVIAALGVRRDTGRFQGILGFRRKDGSTFSGELSSAVFTDASGESRTSTFIRDITERERREEELRRTNEELAQALAEVQELRGILPICSYCKDIRNDQNYWQRVEDYLSTRTQARFSHSICPDCLDKHFPELQEK